MQLGVPKPEAPKLFATKLEVPKLEVPRLFARKLEVLRLEVTWDKVNAPRSTGKRKAAWCY